MELLAKGWFTETHALWPGQAFSLEVDKVLHREQSEYQDILIFQSKKYGRVLVLDGVVQCSERDEFAYQEMIAHLPLFAHPDPKSVLVIGGGDGGVLREVGKHSCVEEIHICEIDQRVIDLSKEFLPKMAVGYDNPKVKVHVQDGVKFLAEHKGKFDVIITDSPDPIGPAKGLFERPFYEQLSSSLKPGGIMCNQGDCLWLELPFIVRVTGYLRSIFPTVGYAFTTVPSYPSGQIGFFIASRSESLSLGDPVRKLSASEADQMDLKYYDSSVHKAAFTLPRFAQKALGL